MKLFAEKYGPSGSHVDTDRRDTMAKQNRLLVTKTVRPPFLLSPNTIHQIERNYDETAYCPA